MTIRVAVVDDQPLLVSAFTALVEAQPDMTVVATGSNGHEAVDAAARTEIDVMLMDIRMPIMDGVAATQKVSAAGSRPRVLVLTTFNTGELVLGAIGAGARGFLLKDADPAVLLDGIRAVDRGEAVIDPHVVGHLLSALRANPDCSVVLNERLTNREVDVLRLIAAGRTNAEIGQDLFIAETTVKTHVGNLLLKLDARDRVALVILAHSVGLATSAGPLSL